MENQFLKNNLMTSPKEPNLSSGAKVSDLSYLDEMMNGKKHLIKGVIDDFLIHIQKELICINNAVEQNDYPNIKSCAHSMKSSVSIVGISILLPTLKEMEELALKQMNIGKIKELNQKLNTTCQQAIQEIEGNKHKYD